MRKLILLTILIATIIAMSNCTEKMTCATYAGVHKSSSRR